MTKREIHQNEKLIPYLEKCFQIIYSVCILFLTLPHIDAFWRICSRRFLKISWQKKKLLKKSNFSFCHNVFTFFFSNYTYNSRDFPYFWVDIFKVICCRFSVCGKGLIEVFYISHICHLRQIFCMWERVNRDFLYFAYLSSAVDFLVCWEDG